MTLHRMIRSGAPSVDPDEGLITTERLGRVECIEGLKPGRYDAPDPLMRVTGRIRYRPEAGGLDRRRAGAEAGIEYLEGPGVQMTDS